MMSEESSKGWASTASRSFSKSTTDEQNTDTGGVDGPVVRRHGRSAGECYARAAQVHRLPGDRRCGDIAVSAGTVRGLGQAAAEAQAVAHAHLRAFNLPRNPYFHRPVYFFGLLQTGEF